MTSPQGQSSTDVGSTPAASQRRRGPDANSVVMLAQSTSETASFVDLKTNGRTDLPEDRVDLRDPSPVHRSHSTVATALDPSSLSAEIDGSASRSDIAEPDSTGPRRTVPGRILIVGLNYAPEPTGIAPYTAGLAEGLASRGAAVHVITAYPHYPQWRIHEGYSGSVRHEDGHGVSLTRLRPRVPRRGNLLARLRMEVAFGLHAVATQWRQPEVVVLVSPALFSSGIAALGARLRGVPTCIWVQDIYSLGLRETGHGRLTGRAMAMVERRVLRSAHAVVVIHDRFQRHLVDELGLAPERVHVVRNWSHLGDADALNRAMTRRERGWAVDDVIVLHAGNMGAKQGLDNVVKAAALARSRGSRVRFVLLGDGNQRQYLESLDHAGAVEFLDPLPDAAFRETLHAADILLVNERPGLREMCVPSKLTSYFSTGLPVIAVSDEGSITAEELSLAQAGLRVDAAQPEKLLAAAETLADDPEYAAALGLAGQLFRSERLGAEAAIANFSDLLLGVGALAAGGPGGGRP